MTTTVTYHMSLTTPAICRKSPTTPVTHLAGSTTPATHLAPTTHLALPISPPPTELLQEIGSGDGELPLGPSLPPEMQLKHSRDKVDLLITALARNRANKAKAWVKPLLLFIKTPTKRPRMLTAGAEADGQGRGHRCSRRSTAWTTVLQLEPSVQSTVLPCSLLEKTT